MVKTVGFVAVFAVPYDPLKDLTAVLLDEDSAALTLPSTLKIGNAAGE